MIKRSFVKYALLLLVSWVVIGPASGCFQTIETSKNLKCTQNADCFGGLPCVEEICGGELTPESTGDGGTPTEASCPIPGNIKIELCKANSDCSGGAGLCIGFTIPGCNDESRLCTCSSDSSCSSGQKCCDFAGSKLCVPGSCSLIPSP